MGTGATNGRGPGLLEDEWAMAAHGLREDELLGEDEFSLEDEALEDEFGAHENLWAAPEAGAGEAWESAGGFESWAGEARLRASRETKPALNRARALTLPTPLMETRGTSSSRTPFSILI